MKEQRQCKKENPRLVVCAQLPMVNDDDKHKEEKTITCSSFTVGCRCREYFSSNSSNRKFICRNGGKQRKNDNGAKRGSQTQNGATIDHGFVHRREIVHSPL